MTNNNKENRDKEPTVEEIREINEDEELKAMIQEKHEKVKLFDNSYPLWMAMVGVLFSLSIYALGFVIVFKTIGDIPAYIYILYIIIIELMLLSKVCTVCYYHGKLCGFGRGKLAGRLFKRKGFPNEFAERKFSWFDMLPSFLIFLIPLGTVILVSIVQGIDFAIMALTVLFILLLIGGNVMIRGQLSCKHCKQGCDFGCPAIEMFDKERREMRKRRAQLEEEEKRPGEESGKEWWR